MVAARPEAAADSSTVRSHNLALVLDDVREHGPTSRAEIAARTGLARASLTTIVPELVGVGLLRDTDASSVRGRGRPAAPLEFDGSHLAVIVAEITVSDVIVESVDLGERPLRIDRASHGRPVGDPTPVVEVASTLIRRHIEALDTTATAFCLAVIVTPAPLAGDPAVVVASSDLGWGSVDLLGLLTASIPSLAGKAMLVNDANMAGGAEARALARELGEPLNDVLYLKSFTGIGGAAITGGQLVTGHRGIGFEPGHILVKPGGRPCVCGRRGCFVAEAGPDTVLEAAGLRGLADSAGMSVAVDELIDRVRAREPQALAAVSALGDNLEDFIINIALSFDPRRVILGGYWADVFDALQIAPDLGLPNPNMLRDAWATSLSGEGPFVVPGKLGARAARTGAIRYAVDLVLHSSGLPGNNNS